MAFLYFSLLNEKSREVRNIDIKTLEVFVLKAFSR